MGEETAMDKKESAMDRQNILRNWALMVAVSFMLAVSMTTPAMAQYANASITDTNDPVYWLDLGGLYATYGSYSAAIEAFNKALVLDAGSAKAYFNRGLSYAETGDLNQALVDINKAISLDSGQGTYYYARGRILLLSGNRDQALKDFRKAADMGDLDAMRYLGK